MREEFQISNVLPFTGQKVRDVPATSPLAFEQVPVMDVVETHDVVRVAIGYSLTNRRYYDNY